MWVQRQAPREVSWIQSHQLHSQGHRSPAVAAQSRGTGDPLPKGKTGRTLRSVFLNSLGFFLPLMARQALPCSEEHPGLLQYLTSKLFICSPGNGLPQVLCSPKHSSRSLFPRRFLPILPPHLCSPELGCDWSPHFWTSEAVYRDVLWNELCEL